MKKKQLTVHDTLPVRVREALRATPHPVRLDDLLRMLHMSRRNKKALQDSLEELEGNGAALRLRGGKWTSAEAVRRVRGTLSVQRSGVGFVTPEPDPVTGKRARQDLYIASHLLGGAWHGDVVDVALLPGTERQSRRREAGKSTRSPEGRVLAVVQRGVTELAVRATRHASARGRMCRPVDLRYGFVVDVDISALDAPLRDGELLMVRLGETCVDNLCEGVALSSLGLEDSAAVQERLVRLSHAIPLDFPANVCAEAQALAQAPASYAVQPLQRYMSTGERVDLRHVPFVTIDGADARDFDDAVCVEPNAPHVLWVAIADVSFYVRPRTALDREAQERGNSYYFPASVTPMLPEALSNDACSLRPDEDRLVMAVRIVFSKAGDVVEYAFFPGVIRSRARLTYEAVQAWLTPSAEQPPATQPHEAQPQAFSDVAPQAFSPELGSMLHAAAALAKQLITRRSQRGGLDFDMPEAGFVLDAQGRVTDVVRRERLFAHRLIEAFMLAANEAAAEFLTHKGVAFPLRAHPAPDPERLRTLFRTLAFTDLAGNLPTKPEPSALRVILEQAANGAQAMLIGRLVLRSMMQARYIPGPATGEDSQHFGLASDAYCHFTSPIRRYADMLVHRALKFALSAPDKATVATGQKLVALCDQCNTRERVAQEAEREITRRMGCLVLESRVGERFEGVIAGVTDFGLFVEPDAMPVEGMIRLETLIDDWYHYDPDRQELVGTRLGRRFRLGQRLVVRLVSVHVGRLEIDFALAGEPTGRVRRQRGRRAL